MLHALALLLPISVWGQQTTCQKSITLQNTNIYENSQTNFAFDFCNDIDDGRGFTSGIIGFCTGTKDANILLKAYTKLNPTNELAKYLPELDRLSAIDELGPTMAGKTSGLVGYCEAWKEAAKTQAFKDVQLGLLDSMYYGPSQSIADSLGLTLPVSRGFLYDIAINQGTNSSEPDSLHDLIRVMAVTEQTPKGGADEKTWIKKLMTLRKFIMCNPVY